MSETSMHVSKAKGAVYVVDGKPSDREVFFDRLRVLMMIQEIRQDKEQV